MNLEDKVNQLWLTPYKTLFISFKFNMKQINYNYNCSFTKFLGHWSNFVVGVRI